MHWALGAASFTRTAPASYQEGAQQTTSTLNKSSTQMSGNLIDGTPARFLRFQLYGPGSLEPIYERAVCMCQITGPK
jgi:hypothetical protein